MTMRRGAAATAMCKIFTHRVVRLGVTPFDRWDPAPLDELATMFRLAMVDFDTVLHRLTDQQRRWLVAAITQTYGPHPWIKRLHT
ncbi:hypothetical protein [Streptomyces sp. OE57]|uniref:hypothetical protein n=1 Tax=Streptomyces lacaronensis TaxID=3379885 RepID=UPI0039B7424E